MHRHGKSEALHYRLYVTPTCRQWQRHLTAATSKRQPIAIRKTSAAVEKNEEVNDEWSRLERKVRNIEMIDRVGKWRGGGWCVDTKKKEERNRGDGEHENRRERRGQRERWVQSFKRSTGHPAPSFSDPLVWSCLLLCLGPDWAALDKAPGVQVNGGHLPSTWH